MLIEVTSKTPACIHKWKEAYPNLDLDWSELFRLPFQITFETKLQSFQYKILHRIFPCNYWLSKFLPERSTLCLDCSLEETIEHYFHGCHTSYMFWLSFLNWWHSVFEIYITLTSHDVVFGIIEQDIPNRRVLNYCILLAKWYIYCTRHHGKNPFFYNYQVLLKNSLQVVRHVYTSNGDMDKFSSVFQTLYDKL